MEKKEYHNSEVMERVFITKLFYDETIRRKYLMQTLPAIFLDKKKRIVLFMMQKLFENDLKITLDTLVLKFKEMDSSLVNFLKKHKVIYYDKSGKLVWMMQMKEEDIYDILTDTTADAPTDIIERYVIKSLNDMAFNRFVEDKTADIKYYNNCANSSQYQHMVLGAAKAINRIHLTLYDKTENSRDQLEEARELINANDEYVRTSSQALNSKIGGFTRGYVASLIAKPSHCKSSWVDFNTVHSILSGKIKRADIITPEESAATRWKRIIAMLNLIPSSKMRQKDTKVLDEHIRKVKEKLWGKLFIWDNVFKYSDVLDLMNKLKTDMIIVDHLQSIDYPGSGNPMMNMIGGIPGFISHQKRIAKQHNNVIIDLSQVNTKEIERSERLVKMPKISDAYGGSALEQASREFLILWYPFRDYEEGDIMIADKPYTDKDVIMGVAKSSYSGIGKISFNYDYEYDTFTDKVMQTSKRADYQAPKESQLNLM